MSDLDQLLDLQANDTGADQLRHRRATLPERDRLRELDGRREALEAEIAEPRARRDELVREQKRLEDEVATVEDKAAGVDRQLYGGGVTAPKEAQALQADLESLKRRQSQLEDQVLEVMEELEPLEAAVADNDAALAEVASQQSDAERSLAAGEAEIDAELEGVAATRQALAERVPEALLAEYERLRPQLGGVAVARLEGATCQGCHLSLAAAEVDEIRRLPTDAVVHCPDCGRLLVR